MALKRSALTAVLALGVVLALFPFVTNLFGKTGGVETLTGDLRTTFTDTGLAQTRADMDAVGAMSTQLQKQLLPDLPSSLGLSDREFGRVLQRNDPAVAAGVAALPTVVPRFDALVTGLEQQQSNFEQADSIPTGFLPSTVVPYLLLLVGCILALLARLALSHAATRDHERDASRTLTASLSAGIVLVGAAIVLSLGAKGAAVDHLTDDLRPYFTAEGAAKSRADLDVLQAMADELQADTLPWLAGALDMSPRQLTSFLAKNYPDVAAGVTQLDAVLPRFQAAVTTISSNVDSFAQVDSLPFSWMPTSSVFWWLLLPGLALIAIPVLLRSMGPEGSPIGARVRAARWRSSRA